jgi:hypothetical protein
MFHGVCHFVYSFHLLYYGGRSRFGIMRVLTPRQHNSRVVYLFIYSWFIYLLYQQTDYNIGWREDWLIVNGKAAVLS